MAPRRPRGHAFVISSPSGGGKTTVVAKLLRRVRGLERSISATTRAPRPGEVPGRDYLFVSRARFAALKRRRQLLEWATVHGASYGTPRRPVDEALARGRDIILSIDVQGARTVRRLLKRRAVLVFLLPPSLEALRRRLTRRRTESTAAMRRRLQEARRELACARWYDETIVNDRLSDAVEQLRAIIRRARRNNRS